MITLNNDHINNYSTKRSYIFEMYELLVDTSHAGYVKAWNLGISGNIKANLTKVHIFQTLVKFAFKCFINIAIRSC